MPTIAIFYGIVIQMYWRHRVSLAAMRADGCHASSPISPPPLHQFVVRLQPEEKPFRHPKVAREPQVGVRG